MSGKHAKPYYGGESLDAEALAAAVAAWHEPTMTDLGVQQMLARSLRAYINALDES